MSESTYTIAQEAMVQQQLIRRGITDERVLAAMRRVPRHLFVPPVMVNEAYLDKPVPIGYQQTISQPYIVAHMTELLQLPTQGEVKVLEIGTGLGYQAAILSYLVTQVYTVERITQLAKEARERIIELGLKNINMKVADGGYGWPDQAPYQAIIVTAAAPFVPPPLIDQLADGGVLLLPIGAKRQPQYLLRLRRHGDKIEEERLTPVAFVPFLGEHGWAE